MAYQPQPPPAPQPSQPATVSFPSPKMAAAQPPQFVDAVKHAKNAMRSYDAAVLRCAVRELWELTVLGSADHNAFLCKTLFHRTPPETLSRAVEEQGLRLVKSSAIQIAKHLTKEDLDSMAPTLFSKLSPRFLDKALALRLETIQAQQLVNALGRAERLGYDVRDVVTENPPGNPPGNPSSNPSGKPPGGMRNEWVIPTTNPIPVPPPSVMPQAPRAPLPPPPPTQQQQLPPQSPFPSDADIRKLAIVFCEHCNRPCGGLKALMSHRRSGLCGSPPAPLDKFGKEYCLFCGQRFLGNGGLAYHKNNNVCGTYSQQHTDALTAIFTDAERVLKEKQGAAVAAPRAAATAPPTRAASQSRPPPSPSQQSDGLPKDPYAALSPTMRLAFDAAMARIEHQYAEGMKKAYDLPAEAQKAELARLKNLYNNKQSTTRKKFGIRLRERRSKAEIDEERARMLSSPAPPLSATKPHRAVSEVSGTPASTADGGSTSRQGIPKRAPLTEMGIGQPAVTPAAAAAASKVGAPPGPMSIEGSYTTPVRAPDAAMSGAQNTQPIEVDDDSSESGDEHADSNQSATEMDVDGQEE